MIKKLVFNFKFYILGKKWRYNNICKLKGHYVADCMHYAECFRCSKNDIDDYDSFWKLTKGYSQSLSKDQTAMDKYYNK